MGEKQDELEQLEEEYGIEKKQLRELEEKLEVWCSSLRGEGRREEGGGRGGGEGRRGGEGSVIL